jgi:hypothetical protein
MAHEIWYSFGGIGDDEVAFDVDLAAIQREIERPGFCPIS